MSATARIVALAVAATVVSGWMRAQNAEPLPDVDALYKTVRENLTRSERLAHLYTFKEQRTDLHTNPFGRIGTGGTRAFEVHPSIDPQLTYRRLVERNGVPLGVRELAAQDREYAERVAARQRRAAREPEADRREREEAEARSRRRAQTRIEDIVNALQFELQGRGTRNGVRALIVTFTPKPTARPTTREGRIAQKFAGTVWIDEAAAQVMQVEAKSIDSISFGFGIVARLGEGTTATLTRAPVAGGVWMPSELTLTGRGRAALVRRLEIDHVIRWSDYRRLSGDSVAPFLDSRQ